ncbi:2-dehydropantoate 2-reductase [Alkalibacillus haloalkaliphilus]|uniref:2-dehydropantoate 2-reductase n=1 Tax=Alkalibacillus haloalkaliphilus TaxID=94136 RepID=UPI0029367583|nr:2-dehydropantoate 2-reductase [Alkalibacillus haloalkaliphilus]MDV2582538.1 2-dehydropantoate 2-reductase [Alkalibacillus haloalkaliphilus]
MNIGVIGMGAVGMLVAHQLESNGHHVTCYVRREEQLKQLKQSGISLVDGQTVYPEVLYTNQINTHELLVVCTKQTQLDPVLQLIETNAHLHGSILFLQNGMGHIQKLEKLKHNCIYVGVCEHGVNKVTDYQIKLNGLGQIKVTGLNSCASDSLYSQVSATKFPITVHEHLIKVLNEKLVVNSVINPLTGLYEIRNGEVLKNSSIEQLAKQLTREASKSLQLEVEEMWELVRNICNKTSENKSSMLIDLENGRETEIDYMNGYLADCYQSVPTHHLMTQLIKAKEEVKGVKKWT